MKKFMQFLAWWLAIALVILGIVNWFMPLAQWVINALFAHVGEVAIGVFILGVILIGGSWILDWGKK